MKLRVFLAVILIIVIAGAGFGLWKLQGDYSQAQLRHGEQLKQIQELEDQAAKLQETLDSITLEEAQARQTQAEELNRQTLELKEQMDALRAEMEAMSGFLEENQDFRLEKLPLPPVFPENDSGMLTLVPGQYDTDGFFIAKLRRNV